MNIQLMDVQRQHTAYASEYEDAALRVLRSGRYIGGEEVSAFENEFALFEGAKFGVSCGNGTDALVIALRALGIGVGDEVITVAWTFFATAESIAAVGAKPVFVDVRPDTYCMDENLVESVITEKTKAIVPVHFYGHCCNMHALRKICNKYDLKLITDCAQSTGSKYCGSKAATLGDVACFSLFPTKVLGCDGDGGIILTNDESIYRRCAALKVHGSGGFGLQSLKECYIDEGLTFPEDMPVGESKYYNYLIGYNSRLDAIQAAILRKKLSHLDEFIAKRRLNAAAYNAALKDAEYKTPFEADDVEHVYYLYVLQHENAQDIIKQLKERGIASGTYYPVPLHLQGAFHELGYKEGDFPVTERLSRTTFAIPVFPELSNDERQYIIDALIEINLDL